MHQLTLEKYQKLELPDEKFTIGHHNECFALYLEPKKTKVGQRMDHQPKDGLHNPHVLSHQFAMNEWKIISVGEDFVFELPLPVKIHDTVPTL